MENFLQLLISGIMVGGIYGLVALGWVLIYKCSGVLNLAMGELTLIGGYVCLTLYTWFVSMTGVQHTTPAFIAALAASLVVGLILGLLTERIFLRKMIGEPILAVIMVTVGLAFFFKGLVFIVWEPDTQNFSPSIFPSEPLTPFGIAVDQLYLWGFIASLILMAIFVSFFKFTRWGLSMQACADDEMAALSIGVSAKFVYALAWGIAFMSAGVAGTILGNISGLNYSVSHFGLVVLPVVVFGGLNSVPGAIVGGITIGIVQNLSETVLKWVLSFAYVVGSNLGIVGALTIQDFLSIIPPNTKEVAPFVFMVIFLLFKPFGLWGWERIERV